MTAPSFASTEVEPERSVAAPSRHSGKTLHWMEVVSHLDPRYGGMSTMVPALASELSTRGLSTTTVAAFGAPEERAFCNASDVSTSIWPTSRLTWLRNRALSARFDSIVKESDGVHLHGLWEASTYVASRAATRSNKPYIVSAHGMLEPWAMKQKAFKKRLYSMLIEHATLEQAACVHALTHAEADDYRRFGSRRPIAVIPNAVRRPTHVDDDAFARSFPELRNRRVLLFLGRLHFKKGLDILLSAWAEIARRYSDTVLVLAGPSAHDAQRRIDSIISDLHLQHHVLQTGMVSRELAWSALASAHCFVLPSYSEGLSMATLEALAVGTPVITTHQCHLPEVAAYGAGWEIPATHEALAAAMCASLDSSAEDHKERKLRAMELAERRFSWDVVATQMSELYRWASTGEPMRSVELLEAHS